jgi:NAD(P) transhydrogenase subunit alpha
VAAAVALAVVALLVVTAAMLLLLLLLLLLLPLLLMLLLLRALVAVAVPVIGEASWISKGLGFFALIMASVNIFGGFLVTARMLAMYKKKAK